MTFYYIYLYSHGITNFCYSKNYIKFIFQYKKRDNNTFNTDNVSIYGLFLKKCYSKSIILISK